MHATTLLPALGLLYHYIDEIGHRGREGGGGGVWRTFKFRPSDFVIVKKDRWRIGEDACHGSEPRCHQVDSGEPPAHLKGVHVGRDVSTYAAAPILPPDKTTSTALHVAPRITFAAHAGFQALGTDEGMFG